MNPVIEERDLGDGRIAISVTFERGGGLIADPCDPTSPLRASGIIADTTAARQVFQQEVVAARLDALEKRQPDFVRHSKPA